MGTPLENPLRYVMEVHVVKSLYMINSQFFWFCENQAVQQTSFRDDPKVLHLYDRAAESLLSVNIVFF